MGKDFNGFANVRWTGFEKEKLPEYYQKHVVERNEFGNITQNEYLKLAKEFAAETNPNFMETQVGNFLVKYDPATRRVFAGHLKTVKLGLFI